MPMVSEKGAHYRQITRRWQAAAVFGGKSLGRVGIEPGGIAAPMHDERRCRR